MAQRRKSKAKRKATSFSAPTHAHTHTNKCINLSTNVPLFRFNQQQVRERCQESERDAINKSVEESFWNERGRERAPARAQPPVPVPFNHPSQHPPQSPLASCSPCLPRVIATGSTCCHSDCRTKRFARFAAGATKSTRLDSSFATRRALPVPHNLFTVARER